MENHAVVIVEVMDSAWESKKELFSVGCFCYFYSLLQGEFTNTTFCENQDVSLQSHDTELYDI